MKNPIIEAKIVSDRLLSAGISLPIEAGKHSSQEVIQILRELLSERSNITINLQVRPDRRGILRRHQQSLGTINIADNKVTAVIYIDANVSHDLAVFALILEYYWLINYISSYESGLGINDIQKSLAENDDSSLFTWSVASKLLAAGSQTNAEPAALKICLNALKGTRKKLEQTLSRSNQIADKLDKAVEASNHIKIKN